MSGAMMEDGATYTNGPTMVTPTPQPYSNPQ
jgi:hypothetical protein